MSYTIGSGIWSSVFAVPAAVVDEHIKMCSPLSLKILLLMLRHPEHPADIQWLSSRLCISAPDIADALNYWVGAGIVQLNDSPVMEQAADPPAQINISSSALGGPGPVPSVQTQAGENGQRIVTIAARPKIARDDVSEMAKNDDSIAQLLTLSQEILGAPLTPVESEILAALHSYYGLATDAVLMLLQYCVSTGHKSMHYVEKTAAAWLEKGISTYDQIEQEILRLTRNNDQEKKVIQAFGIYNRGLTSKERTYIEQWFAFGIDEKLIALACEKTLENTGKVSFAYADKILAAWKSKGISTVREAIDDSAAAKRSIPQNRSAQTGRDSSIDMDKIRAMLHRQLDG